MNVPEQGSSSKPHNYLVKLDIAFIDDVEVEASSEQEAIEKAYTDTNYRGSIAGVFQVEDLGVSDE